ncbi:hypothetical protein SERLA73DRAFT_162011 [Serpula lacrymans var. lacrymans S7.3]|uniref:JmjC domain-containing histone demethylation protein 1 n=2 Tax=Serpula lacrymans var. lacrymans TaxID=341189 RepID=F8Q605_SERL3|nr:uncharacterized protein SERLADRAFT_417105 [Serpula lacrymans var. lacrymans S7.9]EGN96043.1 hypothetical protein SERLA73DRAFT_162011 [Serpula lacrymans var. lacrymans S7.3]EGO21563.1 hypothetical protein SERLADRAFT_417105 [Serpula lacrymans var. lacrymans S7.9]
MTRGRRRVTRSNARQSPQQSPGPDIHSESVSRTEEAGARNSLRLPTDSCPACKSDEGSESSLSIFTKQSWVRCDACKTWFHWLCVGNGGELETIDRWFCDSCVKESPIRSITFKPPARKSLRKRTQRDYSNLDGGLDSDPNRWLHVMEGKDIKSDQFRRMQGSEVGLEWLESDENSMREPIVIENPEGLGMKMPDPEFTVIDVKEIVGEDTPVEVIDVATQSNSPGWTLGKWVQYYCTEQSSRDKIRNVISLEISGTKLADQILPPRLVRELDWVEKFWPTVKQGKGHVYPKVQLYCLMGVASAWTDWHIDFAGSSVYYHVLRGSKVFYFIRPTTANLAAYERWSGTELQNHVWLGDLVDEVIKVTLYQGNTMIIPTGWIHAVYTPVDSLVFGGNFLHSYNVPIQLKVVEIETSTHVPKKFRFPLFTRLCWYVGDKYLRDLKAKEEFSTRVLESLAALAKYLVLEVRSMERGSEQAKRDAKEQVPSDRIKDAAALARELRWRVRVACGYSSDEEDMGCSSRKMLANGLASAVGSKRRRVHSNDADRPNIFKNYVPKAWDIVTEMPVERKEYTIKSDRPDLHGSWKSHWTEWGLKPGEREDGEQVTVHRQKEVMLKMKRTEQGFEEQHIERIFDSWQWGGSLEDLQREDKDK